MKSYPSWLAGMGSKSTKGWNTQSWMMMVNVLTCARRWRNCFPGIIGHAKNMKLGQSNCQWWFKCTVCVWLKRQAQVKASVWMPIVKEEENNEHKWMSKAHNGFPWVVDTPFFPLFVFVSLVVLNMEYEHAMVTAARHSPQNRKWTRI